MRTITTVAALCAAPAFAQEELPCGSRAEFMAELEEVYGEVAIGYGYDPRNVVIEVYVSAAGTWTLMVTDAIGQSCLIAAGDAWVFVEQPWPQPGEVH